MSGRAEVFTRRTAAFGALFVGLALLLTGCWQWDLDGDGQADLGYWDDDGNLYLDGDLEPFWTSPNGGGNWTSLIGSTMTGRDGPAPGDYDGDRRWEPAFVVGGVWHTAGSAGSVVFDPSDVAPGIDHSQWVPVPGNYDQGVDGRDYAWEMAWYDYVTATWYVDGEDPVQFGIGSDGWVIFSGSFESSFFDVPLPADYDGDGDTDIGVYRVLDGTFRTLEGGLIADLGLGFPVAADLDPDRPGMEPAIYHRYDQGWYSLGMPFLPHVLAAGQFTQGVVAADYDSDGTTDLLVHNYSAGSFHSPDGSETILPGAAGSFPLGAQYVVDDYVRIVFTVEECHEEAPPECPPGIPSP